jgi:squalene-hopene/tetraprenyl-beta-curcumene cyclase
MKNLLRYLATFAAAALIIFRGPNSPAAEPVTLANVSDPGPNQLEEPLAADFSVEAAARFLDSASLQWQKQRKCFTCHTNFAYLYARPFLSDDSQSHREVRRFAEQLVRDRWPEEGPRWDAEIVAAAAALAFNDAHTSGKLHEQTRVALDRMWTVQRDDGGWDWLKCDWPPLESDDHYGATLAAIAVGVAPEEYKNSPTATQCMEALRGYFAANPPTMLHHKAMLLWAARYHENLISSEEREACLEQLWQLQKVDGGWALATLGDWQRHDGTAQNMEDSDGYGTGFVIFVLRQAGIPAGDPRLQRGVDWLKTHQRESGRWITRSLYKDSKHFISHAGSAFAIMALAECDALH